MSAHPDISPSPSEHAAIPIAASELPRRRMLPPAIQPVQGGSLVFLLSVAIVLTAAVFSAWAANFYIVQWAINNHMHTAQLRLTAAMGGLFAGGFAALIAILIVTSITGRRSRNPDEDTTN